MTTIKSKPGRPTTYTPELAALICDAIASTSKGIRRLSSENESFPNPDTIYRWIKEYKEFSDQYARAKRHQVEVIVDEIMEIADETSQDAIEDPEGKIRHNKEHIHRSRLRIDTRKWLAAKLAPKLYGDKAEERDAEIREAEEAVAETARARKAYEDAFKKEC